ncbi:MAG: TonB-dependent receptor [Pyrinomonadaceae bacterium]
MNFSILKSKMFLAMLTALFAVSFAGSIFAQSGTATVVGSITDQTGAGVPGATVTISNPSTGFKRTATSDSQGNYTFPGIPNGTYRLEVEATGFKKAVNTNVQALVDSTATIPVVLEPGEVSIEVDVTTGTIESVVNTQDSSLGNNFTDEQITQLPTDLRRVNDLLALQPGVTRDGYVAGGRSDQANITLDGVDINDQQTGGRAGTGDPSQGSALRATTESVEEFRITTVGANANQGRSSGAQISLVTKRGKNNFEGSAFYFYRPTMGSANDFFNNLAGLDRPSLARNVYGGSIGGPIKRDRLFFFYSYEGQYQTQDASVTRTVPLAHLGNGEIHFAGTGPSCSGGQCVIGLAELNTIYSEVGINPAAVAVLAGAASRYAANTTSVGDGINTGGFAFNAPTITKENTHIARFDWTIADNQEMFFRANYQWDNTAGTSMFPDTPATSFWSHPYGGVVGHNWTISDNKINNFRFGLTRQAFSSQGDSADNAISFRFVYSPLLFSRTLSRVTPVYNITDDFTWIKENHTVQIGGNVRLIRNQRNDFSRAYDSAVTNPSFYNFSGAVINAAITDAGYTIDGGSVSSVQAAATALIGRYSQYSGNFTFGIDGSVLAAGTPSERSFATEEYDTYIQDIWKLKRNLTITGGLRYAYSRPVYEQNGFQVVPQERLGDIFDRRAAAAEQGVALNEIINFELAGPKNGGQGFYSSDWNNLQPSIAVAWSPNFKNGPLKAIFGGEGESTFRGGFRIANDYFGGQLAVSFDGLSTIGFVSTNTIAANTYDITGCGAPPDANGVPACAPLFTGFDQSVRSLPGIPAPAQRFNTPADEAQRIESSLDGTIVSPTHYVWNASWGRSLPGDMYFEASYIGRKAKNLFATRDVLALNNLVDPISGMDWYTAAGILHDLRAADTPNALVPAIPYFENLFDTVGLFGAPGTTSTQGIYNLISRVDGFDILDWTFVQLLIDDAGKNGTTNLFFHPQYAAFSSFGTTAYSNYHGGSFSLRQRLRNTLSYDVNYTFSKSMDNASGLQTDGSYGGQFILNSLRPDDNYSVSDFDTKHVVNANFLFSLPVGKGKAFFSDMGGVADAIFGGWELRGIYRWNSGQPISPPFDQAQWATNWNVQSNGTQLSPINFTVIRDTQNAFANPQQSFNSLRNARPGETGERNTLRLPGFQTLDMGLQKEVRMPWSEKHKMQLRWEVFNVTNIQYFLADNATRASYGLPQDPETGTASSSFGKIYSSIQGNPRRMQFGLRYQF